jgi:hypothetical protein
VHEIQAEHAVRKIDVPKGKKGASTPPRRMDLEEAKKILTEMQAGLFVLSAVLYTYACVPSRTMMMSRRLLCHPRHLGGWVIIRLFSVAGLP